MVTRRWARRFGGILVLCGLFITSLMGTVTYYTAPMMLHPGKDYGGTRFSGTPGEAAFALGIFAVVLAFGLTSLCYGVWQVRTGKRSKRVAFAMLGLWAVLLLAAAFIRE
jgi:MFS family permease